MDKKPHMNVFATRDEKFHRDKKRPVANAYAMTSLLELEPGIDSCTKVFTSRLDDFANQNAPVDLGAWLQYYALDVVGEITFAKKLGFLEEVQDIDGVMKTIQAVLVYSNLCGQVPEIYPLLLGNPLLPFLAPGIEKSNQVLQFTLKVLNPRELLRRGGEIDKEEENGGKDMMSRWMALHRSNPEKLSTTDVVIKLLTNVFSGSDTTAIALRAVFYLLMRYPAAMAKVQAEIDSAADDQKLGNPVSYQGSVTYLPYVGAALKEAMRLHPSVGLILEREVPTGGVSISGKHIPGGGVGGR